MSNPTDDDARVRRLTAINLDDMLAALGWEKVHIGRRLLSWPFLIPARRFAVQVLDYDRLVDEHGLQAGSQRFLPTMIADLQIEGQERIPEKGPVLFLANHPGMTDTLSLFASIPRPDLRVVAADRPFLRLLRATDRYLIYVSEQESGRSETLRAVTAHLRSGGATLTFPAGQIEPDPAVLPGALASLDSWSSSIGIFARLVPEAVLVPVIVCGVLSSSATFHPFTRLRRRAKDRERLGATLQILASVVWPSLWPGFWQVTVRVRFGLPIQAASLLVHPGPQAITREVVARIRPFMRQILEIENFRW